MCLLCSWLDAKCWALHQFLPWLRGISFACHSWCNRVLDDVHVATHPKRTRGAYNHLEADFFVGAGIRLHIGKACAWNRGGIRPPDVGELGEDVWDLEGMKIFGTPAGSEEFVQKAIDRRLEDEAKSERSHVGARFAVRIADFTAMSGVGVTIF